MAIVDKTNGTKVELLRSIGFSEKQGDPSDYAIEDGINSNEGGMVILPHITTGGAGRRVSSEEEPYGHIEVVETWMPDPKHPEKTIKVQSKNIFSEMVANRIKEAKARKGTALEEPEDADLAEVLEKMAVSVDKLIPDTEEEYEDEEEDTEPAAPEMPWAISPAPAPEPKKKMSTKKLTLSGSFGKYKGNAYTLICDDSDMVVTVTPADSGIIIPPLDVSDIELQFGTVRMTVKSTGIGFEYHGKMFVVFATEE